jgi:hypothetical protein
LVNLYVAAIGKQLVLLGMWTKCILWP